MYNHVHTWAVTVSISQWTYSSIGYPVWAPSLWK